MFMPAKRPQLPHVRPFILTSTDQPAGDQPQAIARLIRDIEVQISHPGKDNAKCG